MSVASWRQRGSVVLPAAPRHVCFTHVPLRMAQRQPQLTHSASPHAAGPRHEWGQQSGTARQGVQAEAPRHVSTRAGLDISLLATTAPSLRDSACFIAAGLGARVWTKLFDVLVAKGFLEQKLSRKLVHTTTGPIFLLTWPLFSANPWARVLAALVPMINVVRLLTVGLGAVRDDGLVHSVSRSGDRTELLKGPLYYCLVLITATLFCWREEPAGLIAVCLMCGGDGLADIVGRRLGKGNSLPYNSGKTWAGSIAMLLGGALMALGLFVLFCTLGYFECYNPSVLLPYLLVVSAIATVVESLPVNQVLDDNLTVPLVAALSAMLLMPHAAAQAALLLPCPV